MPGTIIYSILESPDPKDKNPHVDSNKVWGGHQIRNTISERDAIDIEIRKEGQTCDVLSIGKTFKLEGGIQNINWVEKVTSNVTFKYVTPQADGTVNI